jgi:hypothetical protein
MRGKASEKSCREVVRRFLAEFRGAAFPLQLQRARDYSKFTP